MRWRVLREDIIHTLIEYLMTAYRNPTSVAVYGGVLCAWCASQFVLGYNNGSFLHDFHHNAPREEFFAPGRCIFIFFVVNIFYYVSFAAASFLLIR